MRRPSTWRRNFSQLAAEGQPRSPGRTRRPTVSGAVRLAEVLDVCEQPIVNKGIAAVVFRKCLLFTADRKTEEVPANHANLRQ